MRAEGDGLSSKSVTQLDQIQNAGIGVDGINSIYTIKSVCEYIAYCSASSDRASEHIERATEFGLNLGLELASTGFCFPRSCWLFLRFCDQGKGQCFNNYWNVGIRHYVWSRSIKLHLNEKERSRYHCWTGGLIRKPWASWREEHRDQGVQRRLALWIREYGLDGSN